MNEKQNDISLDPLHLVDLRKSGLSDETIKQASIYSVRPADIPKKLGFENPEIQSVMAFPYGSGFERFKIFPSLNGLKYVQPKGSKNRLYISNLIRSELSSKNSICITEGEKKTLKAIQEGFPTIGIGGLWNWSDGSEEKNLIPDFDLITWDGREVLIVPDNDWLNPDRQGERKNLREAVYELAYRLIDRGAKVYIIELLPGLENKGLDDYLCHHTAEEFKRLPKREVRKETVEEMINSASLETLPDILKRFSTLKDTEKNFFAKLLAKKLNVPKNAILKDAKRVSPQKSEEEPLYTAHFRGLVDLCEDEDGNIVFLVKKNNILWVSPTIEIDNLIYRPPEKTPFLLPKVENVLKWFPKDKDESLFQDVLKTLKKFSFIQDHQFIFTSLFIFLTYLQDHRAIQYLPIILFWSVPERGKSRTGKAVIFCSYRGVHIVDMREANLFRYSQDFKATLFIDSMNLWKKAEKNGCEDILLLRYEKGAMVARVLYPERGPFRDMVYFEVFGPTILATNEPVHHILDTRCLPVAMPNKPKNYENPTAERLRDLRERLTAWRGRVMNQELPEIDQISGIHGRLWDISKPLFQVCQMICPIYQEVLQQAILEISKERVDEKRETLAGEIVAILKDLSPEEGVLNWEIKLEEVVSKLNEKRPEEHKLSSRYVGQRIKALSLKKHRGGHSGGHYIELARNEFDLLLGQYGFEGETVSQKPSENDIEKNSASNPQQTFSTFSTSCNSIVSGGYDAEHLLNVQKPSANIQQTFSENNSIETGSSEHAECAEHSMGGIDTQIFKYDGIGVEVEDEDLPL